MSFHKEEDKDSLSSMSPIPNPCPSIGNGTRTLLSPVSPLTSPCASIGNGTRTLLSLYHPFRALTPRASLGGSIPGRFSLAHGTFLSPPATSTSRLGFKDIPRRFLLDYPCQSSPGLGLLRSIMAKPPGALGCSQRGVWMDGDSPIHGGTGSSGMGDAAFPYPAWHQPALMGCVQ